MAEGDDKTAGDKQPTQATPDPQTDRRYSRDELRERARSLLDVSPHVVAAALADEDAKTFTLKKAKELVSKAERHEEAVDDHRSGDA